MDSNNKSGLKTWQDYWVIFDELCFTLSKNNKPEIVAALKEVQKYVNGFTDGWFDFLHGLQAVVAAHQKILNDTEMRLVNFLISALEKSLRR